GMAHNNLGVVLKKQGQVEQAITYYRKAIELYREASKAGNPEPAWEKAHRNLGDALVSQGHLDEAIAEYRVALGLKADDAETHHSLGLALSSRGRPEEAIAEYQK